MTYVYTFDHKQTKRKSTEIKDLSFKEMGCEVNETDDEMQVTNTKYNLNFSFKKNEFAYDDSLSTVKESLKILRNKYYLSTVLDEAGNYESETMKAAYSLVNQDYTYKWEKDDFFGNIIFTMEGKKYKNGVIEDNRIHLVFVDDFSIYQVYVDRNYQNKMERDNSYNASKSLFKIDYNYFNKNIFIMNLILKYPNDIIIVILHNDDNRSYEHEIKTIRNILGFSVYSSLIEEKKVENEKNEKLKIIKYNDIFGLENIIFEMKKFGDMLIKNKDNPEVYDNIPKKILFIGEPGCGKTMLVNAFANENDFSITDISYRDLEDGHFQDISRPCKNNVVFIDEIDKFFSNAGSNTNYQKIQHELLSSLSDINNNNIVIACANSLGNVPEALLRTGRFDIKMYFPKLTSDTKAKILEGYVKKSTLRNEICVDDIVNYLGHVTASDIGTIVNYADVVARSHDLDYIDTKQIIDAIEIIIFGVSEKEKLIKDDEIRIAIHESGHAVVSILKEGLDSISSLSIIQNNSFNGRLIKKEKEGLLTTKDLENMISISIAGYLSELVFYETQSLGTSSDFSNVNSLINNILTKFNLEGFQGANHLNSDQNTLVDNTKISKKIVRGYIKKTLKLIKKNKELILKIANLLVEKKVLYKKDIETVLDKNSKYVNFQSHIRNQVANVLFK
jgi:cell division protease FtsH